MHSARLVTIFFAVLTTTARSQCLEGGDVDSCATEEFETTLLQHGMRVTEVNHPSLSNNTVSASVGSDSDTHYSMKELGNDLMHTAGSEDWPLHVTRMLAKKSADEFMLIANSLHDVLRNMYLEWWSSDGAQLGIYRYGHNFWNVENGVVVVDRDVDVMVRVESREDFESLAHNISRRLVEQGNGFWSHCEPPLDYMLKFTCHVDRKFVGANSPSGCLSNNPSDLLKAEELPTMTADIHGYVVNTQTGLAVTYDECMEDASKCRGNWPFQAYGGGVPYKGVIVNNDTMALSKGLFGEREVPVPYMYEQLATLWNDGEYGKSVREVALPEGAACVFERGAWIWQRGHKFTEKDIADVVLRTEYLRSQGYAAFDLSSIQLQSA